MTEKELRVANAKIAIREQESRVREAENNLRQALKKSQAELAKLVADNDREECRLREDLVRHTAALERDRNWLVSAKADLERGFEA